MVKYLCISVSVLPLSTIFVLNFGTVPTVWYLCTQLHESIETASIPMDGAVHTNCQSFPLYVW
jgi:hypothetical protein